MDTPPIFVLTGQLAAGKSTLAVALARRYDRGTHIDVDAIRETVVSGLASPIDWTDETARQFELAVEAGVASTAIYRRAGFAVVIEGAVDPGAVDRHLQAVGLIEHRIGVVLHPPLEIALQRNRERATKPFEARILEPVIKRLDADLRREPLPMGWHGIDNGDDTIDATVERLLGLIPRGPS